MFVFESLQRLILMTCVQNLALQLCQQKYVFGAKINIARQQLINFAEQFTFSHLTWILGHSLRQNVAVVAGPCKGSVGRTI